MTKPAGPVVGDVFTYPYLWAREHAAGEEAGRKDRPVCVAVAITRARITHLFFLPITSTPPTSDQVSIEVPGLEARRAGLDDRKAWVIISEANYDILETSYDFDPSTPPIGRFSLTFTTQLRQKYAQLVRRNNSRTIPRQ